MAAVQDVEDAVGEHASAEPLPAPPSRAARRSWLRRWDACPYFTSCVHREMRTYVGCERWRGQTRDEFLAEAVELRGVSIVRSNSRRAVASMPLTTRASHPLSNWIWVSSQRSSHSGSGSRDLHGVVREERLVHVQVRRVQRLAGARGARHQHADLGERELSPRRRPRSMARFMYLEYAPAWRASSLEMVS